MGQIQSKNKVKNHQNDPNSGQEFFAIAAKPRQVKVRTTTSNGYSNAVVPLLPRRTVSMSNLLASSVMYEAADDDEDDEDGGLDETKDTTQVGQEVKFDIKNIQIVSDCVPTTITQFKPVKRTSRGRSTPPVLKDFMPPTTNSMEACVDRENNSLYALPLPSTPNKALALCSHQIVHLLPATKHLAHVTTLQLCCNSLTSLPDEIGLLLNLQYFSVSRNALLSIPDSIAGLTNLCEINLSHNRLNSLPEGIGRMASLVILQVSHNHLQSLPSSIGQLQKLVSLNVSHNQLPWLPVEISRLSSLRRLRCDSNPFVRKLPSPTCADIPKCCKPSSISVIPSLKELAGRVLLATRKDESSKPDATTSDLSVESDQDLLDSLPEHLHNYLSRPLSCSFCTNVYIDHYVSRFRWVVRFGAGGVLPEKMSGNASGSNPGMNISAVDLVWPHAYHEEQRPSVPNTPSETRPKLSGDGDWIPLEYRLCKAHWNVEGDRIRTIFAAGNQ